MSNGLENLRKTLTERYEFKPIPRWLGSLLSWILILLTFVGIWLTNKHWSDVFVWIGLGLFVLSGLIQLIVIMRTRW